MVMEHSDATIRKHVEDMVFYVSQKKMRLFQLDVALAIIRRKDVFLIAATGSGKTLAFQSPILTEEEGLALVVSPLISLMKEQV